MNITQLIPWNRNRSGALVRRESDPFFSLQRNVNQLFDEMWREFDGPFARHGAMAHGWPAVDLVETDRELTVAVEVPGMSEKDVEVQFVDNSIVVSGERRAEREDGRRMSERYYGRFERRIPLAVEVDPDQAKGEVRNGVLTITLPKTAQSQPKSIPVSRAA